MKLSLNRDAPALAKYPGVGGGARGKEGMGGSEVTEWEFEKQ